MRAWSNSSIQSARWPASPFPSCFRLASRIQTLTSSSRTFGRKALSWTNSSSGLRRARIFRPLDSQLFQRQRVLQAPSPSVPPCPRRAASGQTTPDQFRAAVPSILETGSLATPLFPARPVTPCSPEFLRKIPVQRRRVGSDGPPHDDGSAGAQDAQRQQHRAQSLAPGRSCRDGGGFPARSIPNSARPATGSKS